MAAYIYAALPVVLLGIWAWLVTREQETETGGVE